jgi:hypothetical protein
MALLLGISDKLVRGTGLYIYVFNIWSWLLASVLFIDHLRIRLWAKLTLLCAFVFFPITFLYVGIVWKDILFSNFAILGFVLLHIATQSRWRSALCIVGLVCVAWSSTVRQQGFILYAPACVIGFPVLYDLLRTRFPYPKCMVTAACLLIFIATTFATNQIIRAWAKEPPRPYIFATVDPLMAFDIAGMIANNAKLDFKYFVNAGIDTATLRLRIKQTYSPERKESLTVGERPHFYDLLSQINQSTLHKEWWRMLRESPWSYVRHRTKVFAWHLGLYDIGKCLPYHVGISPDPAELVTALGVDLNPNPLGNTWLRAFGGHFLPWFRPIYFVIAGLCLMGYAMWRRQEVRVVVPLQAASFLYVASFWLIGVACDFRYMYLNVLAAMFSLVALLFPTSRAVVTDEVCIGS